MLRSIPFGMTARPLRPPSLISVHNSDALIRAPRLNKSQTILFISSALILFVPFRVLWPRLPAQQSLVNRRDATTPVGQIALHLVLFLLDTLREVRNRLPMQMNHEELCNRA